jgi:O-antigen/teichoic acid export membrane protein
MKYAKRFLDELAHLKNATRGSILLSSGTLIASGIGFLQTLVLSNYLTGETFGTYRYVIAFIGSLGIFSLPGLSTALYQGLSHQKRPDVKKLITIRFLTALLGSIFVLGYSYWQLTTNGIAPSLFWSYCAIAFIFPFSEAWNIYEPLYLSQGNYRGLSTATVIMRFVSSGVAIGVAFLAPHLALLTVGYMLSITIVRVFIYRKAKLPSYEPEAKDTATTLAYSWKLTAISIINIIGTYFDKLFLFHGLGAFEVASYSMATIFADQAKMVVKHIGTIELKNFVLLRGAEALAYMKKRTNLLLIMILPLYGLYVIGVFIFFRLFPKYGQVFPLAVLYGTILFLSTKVYHRAFLEAHQQSKNLLIFNVFATATKIGGIIAFSFMGIKGVVVALIFSELITWIVLEVLVLRLARKQDRQVV